MSVSRMPAHTIAGGFSTLIGMVPWKVAEAAGISEDASALLGGVTLAILALAAWLVRRAAWVEARSYPLAFFHGETFSLSCYLRDFAAFSLVMLLLFGGIWIALALLL